MKLALGKKLRPDVLHRADLWPVCSNALHHKLLEPCLNSLFNSVGGQKDIIHLFFRLY
jgi:hypothetical protein